MHRREKIRHYTLLLTLIFSSAVYSHANYPWVITPKAQKELEAFNKAPLWDEIEGINIGYSESENIEKIKSDFKVSYKNYQSTGPDLQNSNPISMTMTEADITFFIKSFESQCRTFLEFSTKPSGTITQNTGKEISLKELCKMELLAFVLNGYKFKKSKRDRTLILEKSI
jgi:hypothetical protein